MARRQRSRRSASGGETGKLIVAGLLSVVTLAAAGFGIHLWATTPTPPDRNKETMCLTTPPKDIIVIVMDTTDGLPEPSKVEAMKLLTDLIEASPKDAMLDVRIVDPSQRAGRAVLSPYLCNPGDGKDISEFTGAPELAKRQWRDKFRKPLLHELEGSMKANPSKSSPLLQTLQGVALDRFTGASAASARKRLVIVSDMIEFVPGEYTQYPPADLRYEHFKTRPHYKKVRTDLNGAEVDIFYIDRDLKGLNTGTHIQFWLAWINDNNGRLGKAIKLQGAGKS